MFVQLILWTDCNNDCTFCSQKNIRDNLTLEQRKNRLIKTAKWIRDMSFDNDRFGLIGGELFCFDGLEREWELIALAINQSNIERLLLTSNLIGDIHNITNFIGLIDKTITICTSYDTVGRFKDDHMKWEWRENVAMIMTTKADVCCTSLMTQEFVNDELYLPEGVYFNLQEPIISCEWYYDEMEKNKTYHIALLNNAPVNLMKRKDFLNWAVNHHDYIEHYHEYANTHSEELYEFVNDEIAVKYHNRMSMNIAPCGHQYSARCYIDSDRCVQCDVEMLLK